MSRACPLSGPKERRHTRLVTAETGHERPSREKPEPRPSVVPLRPPSSKVGPIHLDESRAPKGAFGFMSRPTSHNTFTFHCGDSGPLAQWEPCFRVGFPARPRGQVRKVSSQRRSVRKTRHELISLSERDECHYSSALAAHRDQCLYGDQGRSWQSRN